MRFLRVSIFCLSLLAASAMAAPSEIQLDTEKSFIEWVGKKVVGKHEGTLMLNSGTLQMEGDQIVGGSFGLDMTTIKNKDMAGTEHATKLERHLKSDDFFSVEKFPVGTFTITKATKLSEGQYEISGELEIKGIRNQVTFPAKVEKQGAVYRATAELQIDRLKWDIKYNSGKFFDIKQLGDKMIYDQIDVALDLSTRPEQSM